jgi:tetratricopeptide (TPR) repeat protein
MSQAVDMMPIDQALRLASTEGFPRSSHYAAVLNSLEAHECWTPWFEAVRSHIHALPGESLDDYVRMIRVNIFYLEDMNSGSQVCKELVQNKKMSFVDFRLHVLDKVLESEDYKTEGQLLTGVWEIFPQREDQISAVERLCFIFEKKSHNEALLHQFYERLRKMQPDNAKALRYFRNLYSQSQDWHSVIDVLKKLLGAAKHKQEVFRYAQELAAVYLYQLGDCREAIRYIEEFCAGSTLDTSTIHYEAYYRLGDLEGCLRVLRSALLVVEEPATRSIVHYRIGSIYEQLNNFQMAYENFQTTLELNDEFFEAIEGLISSSIKLKNWTTVRDWLKVLADRTRSPGLVGQLRAGIQRLDEGISNASAVR